jgi:LPS export ABC transporter protein LptC
MTRRLLVLAFAAAALSACEQRKEPPTATRSVLADSADQVMFHIRTVLTDRGLLRADLRADTAFFFNDNTKIELRTVNTTFYTTTGQKNAVLTSREGTYDTRLHQTEARKDVVVVSEDGRRLTTSQLRYDEQRNEISSDSAFVLTQPGRRVEGIGFVSDPDLKNVRVHQLKGGQTTQGGGFTLPSQ